MLFDNHNILNFFMESCPICCEDMKPLVKLCQCRHKFCRDCCVLHVTQKAGRFVEILCPDPECKKPLDKDSEGYKLLPPAVIEKIKKHQEFVFLQKNSHLKPCSVKDCSGTINMKMIKKQCNKCKKPHCPKCLKLFHEGNCIVDKFDEEMKKNNYQKCPNCSIWVEKKEGCQYIDCKCGTAFCYTCGAQFASDPCRIGEMLNHNNEIRQTLFDLQYRFPESVAGYILFPFKLVFQLVLFLFLTIFGSVCMTLIIILETLCVMALVPCIALHIVCAQVPIECRLCALLALPFIIVFLIILLLFLTLMYPIFRNYYHHGIYDNLEKQTLGMVKCYLGCVRGIFSI